MELGASLVVRVRVLPVEGKARGRRQLQADLRVEPGHGSGCVESPTIEGEIGVAVLTPGANRDVEECPDVPVPIPLVPANERVRDRIAEVGCTFIKVELTANLQRPIE